MHFIDIHTHHENNNPDIFSIRSYSIIDNNNIPVDKPFSVGVHPWDSEKFNFCHFDTLRRISNQKNLKTIGETGLDKLKGAEFQIQKKIFEYHVELADKIKKPLIIHCVKYFNELIEIHDRMQPKSPWIIHSFSRDLQLAKELTKRGIHLSFGPILLKSISNPYKYFSEIEKQFIFVETDDSNNSIQEIYEQAAELRGIELEEMADIIESNFIKCFGYAPVVK